MTSRRTRHRLVQRLKDQWIRNAALLAIIGNTPRHIFVDEALAVRAYDDTALPIGHSQTISQPYIVARMTELLLENGMPRKVLEVGTGSGYQAIVLIELGAKVYSIERQRKLYDRTRKLMHDLGYMAKLFYGDGYKGLPTYAPFDKIIVTAGAPEIPKELLKQLKVGGVMVIPIGGDEGQVMYSITRISEVDFEQKKHGNFAFVPMLKNRARD